MPASVPKKLVGGGGINPFFSGWICLEHFARIMEHFAKIMEHFARIMEHFAKIMEHLARIMILQYEEFSSMSVCLSV